MGARFGRRAEQMRRHNGNIAVAFAQVPVEVSPVASRRYCTTRPLGLQVTRALDQLGVPPSEAPTTAMPMAL
jgi:hypothetical protein